MRDTVSDVWTGKEDFDFLKRFPIYKARRGFLERKMQVDSHVRSFEAGSGPAHDSLILAEKGAEVTAFDQSETALSVGKVEYSRLGYHLETICGDLRSIPVEDDTYDLVWNAGVIEHFRPGDDLQVIAEMKRITRPGGVVLVIVPNTFYFLYQVSLKRNPHRQYHFERSLTRFSLIRLMREAGLHNLKASGDYVHPNLSFCLPGTALISKFLEKAFMPLENANRYDAVKSLIGLEVAAWGKK